ncbi:MAG: glycosyltransferase family 2 protein [Proteobacteria bacterium]|nr:glycosyltransferase family 2 protein [Pseudomonadota bacterium]MBU1687260.1 glycosyltransferase family 2 protein [Pseudomonadota bacterium]
MNIPLSVVILTKNCAETLATTLHSLEQFPEVVIFDNGSSDDTIKVARCFSNVTVCTGDFIGFGPTRNKAAALAGHNWVLALDSDEILNRELVDEIAGLDFSDPLRVYALKRDNYFLDRHIKHSGWGNDWLVRIYHRSTHAYHPVPVHEGVALTPKTRISRLRHSFRHDAVREVGAFLKKIDLYSVLNAAGPAKPFPLIILRSWLAFLKSYILKLGFMDGWRGYVIAKANSTDNFFKYLRRYQNHKIKNIQKLETSTEDQKK